MKKLLFSLIAMGLIISAQAQTSMGGKKKSSIAVRFNALDFGTAEKVQNGSIGSVLNAKKWGQYQSTTKSFGVNYTSQLTDQVDLYSNVDMAVTRKPLFAANAITVSGEVLNVVYDTFDASNSYGLMDVSYSTSTGILTNGTVETITVLVSGQLQTDNVELNLALTQPLIYIVKNVN
jgi:hypothetical protein